MNLKMLLTVYALLMLGLGVPHLVVPSAVADLNGAGPVDSLEIVGMRSYGVMCIGVGVMCWTARTAEASKALMLGLTVINGLYAAVAVLPAIAGRGSLFVWADTALFVLFTVLFIVLGRRAMSDERRVRAARQGTS